MDSTVVETNKQIMSDMKESHSADLSHLQQTLAGLTAAKKASQGDSSSDVDDYAQKVLDYIMRFHSEIEYLGLQAYKIAEEKEKTIQELTKKNSYAKSQIESLHSLVIKLSKDVSEAREESAKADEALKAVRAALLS